MRMKRVVKRMVRKARKIKEEWTLNIAENFKENKKTILKAVNEVRKRKSLRVLSLRTSMDEKLTQENDDDVRWRKYFVQLLNGHEISELGGDARRGTEKSNVNDSKFKKLIIRGNIEKVGYVFIKA